MNINEEVLFILTAEGERIIRERDCRINEECKAKEFNMAYDWFKWHETLDEYGTRKEQLWQLFEMFGPHMSIGAPPFFEKNEIRIKGEVR